MGNRVQPGGRVDEELYERFREFVRREHGAVRGNLGTELETAMRERMDTASGPDSLTRIENDIATIKAQLADTDADGGTVAPTPSDAENTHARDSPKPAPNQPRQKKVEWLIGEIFTQPEASVDGGQVGPRLLRNIVTDSYSFDESIVDEYVSDIEARLKSEHDAEWHPDHGQTLVWGDVLEAAREDTRDDVSDELDNITEGTND